jgi:hypothetical protein
LGGVVTTDRSSRGRPPTTANSIVVKERKVIVIGSIDDEAEGAGVLHREDKPDGFLLSSKETGVITEFLNSAIVRWRGRIGVGLLTDGDSVLAVGLRQSQRQGRTGWWGGWPEAHLIKLIQAVSNVHFATSELFQSLAVSKPYHQKNE